MSILEDKLIEKFRKLDETQQQQLLRMIEDMQPKAFEFDEWMQNAKDLHQKMREDGQLVSVQSLLDEIREEASWPRW